MGKIRFLMKLFFAAGLGLILAGCGNKSARWQPGKPLPKENIVLGVIHISNPANETSGYAYEHERGIREMQERLGLGPEQVIRKVNVADADPEGIESVMRDCIALGANIIIATSYGYMDTCEKLAEEFPQVVFAHATGYKNNAVNFTNYFGRIYQARYLSGIAAGLKTRTNRIGYVAAMGKENSEVSGGINAFALGVESVNPAARIHVSVTHSWFDPMEEANAARRLIAEGCDVIAQHCDTPNPQIEAERAGVWAVGYNSDMSGEAPGAVLTSVVWHWGVYYTHLVQSVMDGTFTTAPYLGGLAEGIIDITPLSGLAAPNTAEIIAAARERMETGAFNVFDGELATNDGRIIGSAGATLSDEAITGGMDWYYHTVAEN
ncbi:MAG: BMP family ABC transporter substrate-binding protein [Spirochaetaceae bacterium]|jgi:basic membrane protein A|nr:BMP family ABC transporter substrate-binding protein [Spirochaetaceae bacterium]